MNQGSNCSPRTVGKSDGVLRCHVGIYLSKSSDERLNLTKAELKRAVIPLQQ
jgi:hypothetical protein